MYLGLPVLDPLGLCVCFSGSHGTFELALYTLDQLIDSFLVWITYNFSSVIADVLLLLLLLLFVGPQQRSMPSTTLDYGVKGLDPN